MNENIIGVTEVHKQRAKAFVLESGAEYQTFNNNVTVCIERDDSFSDGSARVSISSDWLFVDDALELSAFFKRLAKTLNKRNPEV